MATEGVARITISADRGGSVFEIALLHSGDGTFDAAAPYTEARRHVRRPRQPRRHRRVDRRVRRPVPSRHALSVAARTAAERHAAAAARLQPARRQSRCSRSISPIPTSTRRPPRPGQGHVHIVRTIFLWRDTAYQRIARAQLRRSRRRASTSSLLFDNDFADLFEVRGLRAPAPRHAPRKRARRRTRSLL